VKPSLHFWPYLTHFFLDREMFQANVVEKIKTHILCSGTSIKKSCHLWDNVEKYCRAGQTTWQYSACALHGGWLKLPIHTHSHTHSGCVILIACPLQEWLHEHTSTLCYTYIACLVLFVIIFFLFDHEDFYANYRPKFLYNFTSRNFFYASVLYRNHFSSFP
jgi:hypothetical protein